MALSGAKTTSEEIDWESLVAAAEGAEYPFFEHDAYKFSRKTFREDDTQGVYEGAPYPTD
ncbi:MAG: hypothetical protein OER87_07570 [Gammaproteobacteria bacterium]|nr:hypothetical protein [Gammaproteobacteria bacterium]MDH3535587.1 hypothetical protein [Gammaproteobacteria bacterium]